MKYHKAYILIGSNKGDRSQMLADACMMIQNNVGNIMQQSSIYETQPWKLTEVSKFLNQAIMVSTNLSPSVLLNKLQIIELILGRVRYNDYYESRPIDLDILFYDQDIINEVNLQIPHPLLHRRLFALVPLMEIANDFIHPIQKLSIFDLIEKCEDKGMIEKIADIPSGNFN
ncbi:2-amino-4-hydroxy-6-hydroxymethyldihydropteridine diphosphokinase [Bacteroidota bacterium]